MQALCIYNKYIECYSVPPPPRPAALKFPFLNETVGPVQQVEELGPHGLLALPRVLTKDFDPGLLLLKAGIYIMQNTMVRGGDGQLEKK